MVRPYVVAVERHPLGRRHGWLVVITWTGVDRLNHAKPGDQRARRYHYHRDANNCRTIALVHGVDYCPEFLPYGDVVGD